MQMTCPKCHGEMRTYERSGVTIDQCTECRGIFLDRGELERLVDVENAHYGQPQQQQPPPQREEYRRPDYGEQPYREQPYRQREHRGHGGYGHHGKKRKKSIFEELFD